MVCIIVIIIIIHLHLHNILYYCYDNSFNQLWQFNSTVHHIIYQYIII